MLQRIRHCYHFIRFNKNRKLMLETLFLSGVYRICILLIPSKMLHRYFGIKNEESAKEEPEAAYSYIIKVAHTVNRVSRQTPWESKCLVQAMTAQHLLKKKQIASTLYLGVGKMENKMVAHAWLRSGRYYVTGGTGEDYALVAKFRK